MGCLNIAPTKILTTNDENGDMNPATGKDQCADGNEIHEILTNHKVIYYLIRIISYALHLILCIDILDDDFEKQLMEVVSKTC